jgi:complete genome
MQNKVTDKNNYRLSNDAYDISDEIIKKGGESRDKKFKVLAIENNKNNGMQAMAVAPVDSNGEIDTKQIEIL